METQKRKRSVILLIAVIIGILLLIYTWSYISKTAATVSADSATSVGTSIAMAMVLPHQVLATLACFFAALGWLFRARWGALVAAILYTVALVLMIPWFYAVLIQMILCYVAYTRMGN